MLLRDVSELRRRDRLLLSKDATIREIHHRVKNNLQTISSLLRLQGRRLRRAAAKAAIEESVRRIRSIALVHEILSREAGDDVAFIEIVRPLVRMVEEGLISPEQPGALHDRRATPATCRPPAATPLAVVLTELLQNVVDHAFPHGTLGPDERAQVRRRARPTTAASCAIAVIDDGVGLPRGVHPRRRPPASACRSCEALVTPSSTARSTFSPAVSPEELARDGPVPRRHHRSGTRVDLTIPVVRAPDAKRPPGTGGRSVGL